MTMIILEKNGVAVRSILVNKDYIKIGRRQGNDCVLSDPSVSGYHAEVRSMRSGCYIKDLSSTNGTFVNDKLVSLARIKPNDVVKLGNSVIRFEFPDPTKESERYSELEPSVSCLNPNISGSDWLDSLSLSLDGSVDLECADEEIAEKEGVLELNASDEWNEPEGNWAILLVKSSNSDLPERRLVLNKPYTKIGATEKCVFAITYDASHYWLECIHGPEFPLLNGAVCRLKEPYRLFDGDRLVCNTVSMVFSWHI